MRRIGTGRTAGGLVAACGMALAAALAPTPAAAESGVKVGFLTCEVAGGFGFIFGSSRDIACTYSGVDGTRVATYKGKISKFGADVGYSASAVMVWGVIAPTTDVKPDALAGQYAGVSASAAVGVGGGANVLVGGLDKSVSLQPVSIEGGTGLNVAAGVTSMSLEATN